MTIRSKILASHIVVTLAVAIIAFLIVIILQIGAENRRQSGATYDQIRAINLIAAGANDYSEQVAELFILGSDPAEVIEARQQLQQALAHKEALVKSELAFVTDSQDRLSEVAELAQIDEMRQTLAALESVRIAVMRLMENGQRNEAVDLYDTRIEHQLDSALGALIDVATDREREKVQQASAISTMLSRRVFLLAVGLVGIVGLLALANAFVLHRAILRPIAALAEGADAVGRGNLAHLVAADQNDELGNLGRRFNAMTGQIREQQILLTQAKQGLEQEVAKRTGELRARSSELEAAVTRLKEIDENRAQFLADISHELRTPLTILRGQAEVTLRAADTPPEKLRDTLRQVVRKAEQMGRLVEDLLFLARSEGGAIIVERDRVILQDVVADVLLDSQGFARASGVTISAQQPPEPVAIIGDHERLRQAMLIPLDNAIKLAPPGTVVRLELVAENDRARIRVMDQGPGFTPEEASRAFVRFFRGTQVRGRTGRGIGLGLSIARWIVDRHDGHISIESHVGQGATVTIELPLCGGAS